MRMGKPNKKPRYARKSIPPNKKPKYASPNLVVGQVSSNLIGSIYYPVLTELANEVLEQYADEVLQYDDAIKAAEKEHNQTDQDAEQVEVDMDGTTSKKFDGTDIPYPRCPLFRSQHVIDEYSQMIQETSRHFLTNDWKIHVNAAKFERRLDEKYGVFRPFITEHPQVELFLRSVQRKYAMGYFSPFRQGDPPLNKTTSIVLLFMLQRNHVKWEILLLASLFLLVGLQPWALVLTVALCHQQLEKRKTRPLGAMKASIEAGEPYYNRNIHTTETNISATADEESVEKKTAKKLSFLHKPVGTKLGSDETIDGTAYDTLLLGTGPATLYTGALLARAGRKVLVLSSREDASGCLVLSKKDAKIPFDIDASNVARISEMQKTLAPALCTSTDLQGGVRFAQIGSPADGYAFEILSIPGMGSGSISVADNEDMPFVVRASGQPVALMEDAATFLGDGWPTDEGDIGNSTSGSYLAVCKAINESSSQYYVSKIIPGSVNALRNNSSYQESSIRYASGFLDNYLPLNAHARSLMAGIGMKGENIKPNKTSMAAHVTNICASFSGEGMYYPIGGPRALCHALATVIEQCGGRVVTDVAVKELLFEEQADKEEEKKEKAEKDDDNNKSKGKEEPAPRCIGVKLANGQDLILTHDAKEERKADGVVNPAVISMDGFMNTFIRLTPEAIRSKNKVPRGLPALSERRPVFKILFALKGSAEDLNVTGADFYRLPGAALARDEIDANTGAVQLGVIGGSDAEEDNQEDENEKPHRDKTAKAVDDVKMDDSLDSAGAKKKKKTKKVKFDSGASWIHISFPSAKDPSFTSCYGKHVTTCVVTIEADDDFVKMFDSRPKLYAILREKPTGELERLLERVTKDLLDLFPQLDGKIEQSELRGPFAGGLSHNPERYAAKGVRPESPYPGLFVGGSDLTVGDSFASSIGGGWLAANAVMGYSAVDYLFLEKNITRDLERFLESPYCDEEDLAVPYAPKLLPSEEPAKEDVVNDQSTSSVPTSD